MAAYDKKMKKIISYDKENDILSIHKGFTSDEQFKGNIDLGDIILDVSTKKRVKGIEIMHATNVLQEFHIDQHSLTSLSNADFSATIKPQSIIISIILKVKDGLQDIPVKIAVPLIRH